MIQALIFDFDGLIIDTESPIYEAWRELYEEFGCQLPLAKWTLRIGGSYHLFDPWEYLEEQLGRPVDRDAVEARRERRRHALVLEQPVLPGVREWLTDAGRLGLKLGIASSSPASWVMGHLERLELAHHFDCIRCHDHVGTTKPDPAAYLSVLEDLGLRADQAIAIEDSPNGITAAKRAGLFCVAVPNSITGALPLDEADLQLDSLAQTPLERLLAVVAQRRGSPSPT